MVKSSLTPIPPSSYNIKFKEKASKSRRFWKLSVYRRFGKVPARERIGLWLSAESLKKLPGDWASRIWWWLPPVIWPEDEQQFKTLVKGVRTRGSRNFVLNAPWQRVFFNTSKGLKLWAGPFCNLSNALAIGALEPLGFAGAMVSPELGREDYLNLPKQCPLPLGIVIAGNWPLCVSRVLSDKIKTERYFSSPKGEQSWTRKYGPDYWVYPNWQIDLRDKEKELRKAGYHLFVHLIEPLPKGIKLKKRPGLWNWDLNLR
jgi:putative protease